MGETILLILGAEVICYLTLTALHVGGAVLDRNINHVRREILVGITYFALALLLTLGHVLGKHPGPDARLHDLSPPHADLQLDRVKK